MLCPWWQNYSAPAVVRLQPKRFFQRAQCCSCQGGFCTCAGAFCKFWKAANAVFCHSYHWTWSCLWKTRSGTDHLRQVDLGQPHCSLSSCEGQCHWGLASLGWLCFYIYILAVKKCSASALWHFVVSWGWTSWHRQHGQKHVAGVWGGRDEQWGNTFVGSLSHRAVCTQDYTSVCSRKRTLPFPQSSLHLWVHVESVYLVGECEAEEKW